MITSGKVAPRRIASTSPTRGARALAGGAALALLLTSPGALAADGAQAHGQASPPDDDCHASWFDVARCHDARDVPLRLMVGADLGVAKMSETGPFGFNSGVGSVTNAGPAWGLRVGVELLPWVAIEARYSGSRLGVQSAVSPAGSLAYLLSAGDLTLRLTAPLPWVHPYLFGGVGYADVALVGAQAAKAGSPLFSSSQTELPMGVGVDVPLTWHLSVGAEATYHFQLSESYSNDTTNGIDGGDVDTFTVVVRARL